MRTPAAAELVRVWELGFDRAPWFRALVMLSPAFPDHSIDRLAALSVGERNVRLIGLRVLLFGSLVQAAVTCPKCAVPLEFSFDLLEVCPDAASPPPPRAHRFTVDAGETLQLTCRVATSSDLAALGADSPALVRDSLARRLVIGVAAESDSTEVPEVSDDIAARIASALEDEDPFAETMMAFDCAACRHEWTAPFDITGFLWLELATHVNRILEDVQRLAKTYGWSEGSILAMTGVRRRFYLDRAS